MRAIDADVLIGEMHNIILEDGEDRRIFYEVIERQPTIEERKTGKWIECDHEKWSGGTFAYICSECGGAYHLNIEQTIAVWNFCPNCGAKMNGGDSDV